MNKLSLYSECDSYDSTSDYQYPFRPRTIRRSFKKKSRREFKIEVSELLAKFAQYSRYSTTLSCRYINHPITSGLIIYIPYIKSKLRTSSLPLNIDKNWGLETNRINFLKIIPETVFFEACNTEVDVSYARIVKKPQTTFSSIIEKEEIWGSRYPNKRYIMNDCIRYNVCRVLNIIMDKCKNSFTTDAIEEKYLNKILFGLTNIFENINMNQFGNLQHVLKEFGKLFQDTRLLFLNNRRLQHEISRLEIEFENQLEIHFGEWNTKY